LIESRAFHYSNDCLGDHQRRRAGDDNERLRPHKKKVNEQVVGPTNGIDMQMEGNRNKISKRSSCREQLDGEKSAT
jgi:hypothetical protein